MSVQISGSTLFNVLQVTQEFFLADFGGTEKGKVSSQEIKVLQGKEGKSCFFSSPDSLSAQSLPYSISRSPLSAVTVSEGI